MEAIVIQISLCLLGHLEGTDIINRHTCHPRISSRIPNFEATFVRLIAISIYLILFTHYFKECISNFLYLKYMYYYCVSFPSTYYICLCV